MTSFFNVLFTPGENSTIVKILLDIIKVKLTFTTLEKELQEHPDYPSLLSISDVLTAHGVENMSLKIDPDDLDKIPLPFIAVLSDAGSNKENFTVVRSVTNNNFEYYDLQIRNWRSVSREKFFEKWPSKVVLIADGENALSEKDYEDKLKEEKKQRFIKSSLFTVIPLLTVTAIFFAYTRYGAPSALASLYTLFSLAGTIVSGLLIWYELDEYNPALQQICSPGKKVNCGAILNSKASKIAGISWSVIGFTYFAGALLLELFSGVNNKQTLFILAWLNAFAALYILFSVYYQWRIAKQWCVLCLYIQGLLAIQLLTTFIARWYTAVSFQSTLSYDVLIPVLLAYLVPFIAASLLMPAYRSAKEGNTNKQELQRLKHNAQIFEALLAKQKRVSEEPEGLGIILGNHEAKNRIIKVCNPYCGPCAQAHVPMEALLENNPDVQLQIIFTATNQENDMKAQPVKHLLAIAEKSKNEETVKHALDDWYLADKKDYSVFAAKYPMNGELLKQNDKVEAMRVWCDKVGIEFTPTFFVNGYQLPEIYNVADLKYFLTV